MQINGKLRQNFDELPVAPDSRSSSQVRFFLLCHTLFFFKHFFTKHEPKKPQALGDVTKGIDTDHTHYFFLNLLLNMWTVQQLDKYFIIIIIFSSPSKLI